MATQENLSVRKAAEELVQAICMDTSASAAAVSRESLNELRHIHGISDKINASINQSCAVSTSLVAGNEKVLSAVADLKGSNDKVLHALVDLKAAVVNNTRLQALHWAITHVKTSKAEETIGNFKYLPEYPLSSHGQITLIDSKELVLNILLSFIQDLGHIVAGYANIADIYGRFQTSASDTEKAAFHAHFQKDLTNQIKMLTGFGTKFVPQKDGRLAIFLAL